MKTSNKLFLAAICTLVAFLVLYDFGLKAQYQQGTYRYVGNERILLNHKNFDRVHVNSSGIVSVMIVPGDYRVEVVKESAHYIHIKQAGSVLTIDMDFPESSDSFREKKSVYLYMPVLKELSTNATYSEKGVRKLNKRAKDVNDAGVVVQGFANNFSLDSLTIRQDNASTVNLTGNKIGFLKTVSGISAGSRSALNIFEGNQIQSAHFEVRGSSHLALKNVAIPKVQVQFSDSAQVELSGASSLSLLKK